MVIKYRPEIDGLRAVAVLAVLFYHAEIWPFTGGFVGVDVFFVISGFLITSIIWNDISLDRFSLVSFYNRRIRRIIPALVATVFVSCIAAAFILLPEDFDAFGKSVVATALSGSNFLFWWDDGYFVAASETKPLLHTWSLAVEEQFYIVFPLLIVLLRKQQRRLPLILMCGALVSFCIAVWSVTEAPQAAFFLLPSRAWELMVGALLAIGAIPPIRSAVLREVLSAAGIFLIVVSVFAYSKVTPFPGIAAIPPCLGAGMIIHAATSGSTHVSRVLGLRPIVFVGLISYSLYLWHWPIIVFVRYVNVIPISGWQTIGIVLLSFVAAVLSWRFVERPFRRPTGNPRITLGWGVASLGAVGLAGLVIVAAKGLPSRFDATELRYIAMLNKETHFGIYDRGKCFLDYDQRAAQYSPDECLPGTSHELAHARVLVWGDSFAAHLYPGLKANLEVGGVDVGQYTATSCRPLSEQKGRCGEFYDALPRILAEAGSMDAIVIAGYWLPYVTRLGEDKFKDRLAKSIELAKSYAKQVILVGQSPLFKVPPPLIGIFHPASRDTSRLLLPGRELGSINEFLASIAQASRVGFYNPIEDGCQGRQCLAMLNGEPLHWDGAHMTLTGSIFYTRNIGRMLSLPPVAEASAEEN